MVELFVNIFDIVLKKVAPDAPPTQTLHLFNYICRGARRIFSSSPRPTFMRACFFARLIIMLQIFGCKQCNVMI